MSNIFCYTMNYFLVLATVILEKNLITFKIIISSHTVELTFKIIKHKVKYLIRRKYRQI